MGSPTSDVINGTPSIDSNIKDLDVEKDILIDGDDEIPKTQLTIEDIYDLNKDEQITLLGEYGLSKGEIRDLRYEEDRVNKILELQ